MSRERDYNRDYNIEMMRVLSCFLVVCIHISNVYSRAYGEITQASYLFSLFTNAFSRVAVPVFFMISGYLLLEEPVSLHKSLDRVFHTSLVLAVWSGVYHLCKVYYLGDASCDLRLIFGQPVAKHLWFLYAILGMYIMLPFFQVMFRGLPKNLMEYFVVLWLFFLTLEYTLALLKLDITYPVPLLGGSCYFGYFAMGYVLRHLSRYYSIAPIHCLILSVVSSVATTAITFQYSVNAGRHVEIFFQYRSVLTALSSVLLFYGVMQGGGRKFAGWQKSILRLISRHSFTIYLSHILFLYIADKKWDLTGIEAWVGIPVLTVGIFVVSLLFSIILDQSVRLVKDSLSDRICYFFQNRQVYSRKSDE